MQADGAGYLLSYIVGGELACLWCGGVKIRFKTNGSGFGLAWIKTISNSWKVAASVELGLCSKAPNAPKFGVLFTHE